MRAVLLRLKPNLKVAEREVPAEFLPVVNLHLHIDGASSRNRHMKAYAGSDVIDRFHNRMGVTARPSCTPNRWRPQYST